MKRYVFYLFCLVAYSNTLLANEWEVSSSDLTMKVKYTLGTHNISADGVKGTAKTEGGQLESVKGTFSVPISSFKEGDAELECHMRESLGLDYKVSSFPEQHACNDEHQLPTEGPNSIAYPEVQLRILGLKKHEDKYEVIGEWTIHGVTKPSEKFFVSLSESNEIMSVSGQTVLSLWKFGIVVKKFILISVSDEVPVDFKVMLKKVK